MTDLTDASFEPIVKAGLPVFVQFWAAWSGPCRAMRPIVETLAAHFERKAVFARLDVDANPEACVRHQVTVIPTLLLFVPGREPLRLVGLQSEAALARMVYRVLE